MATFNGSLGLDDFLDQILSEHTWRVHRIREDSSDHIAVEYVMTGERPDHSRRRSRHGSNDFVGHEYRLRSEIRTLQEKVQELGCILAIVVSGEEDKVLTVTRKEIKRMRSSRVTIEPVDEDLVGVKVT